MRQANWVGLENDEAIACAIHGDCLFDLVQEGAQLLEREWSSTASGWESLLKEATKGWVFGLLGGGDPALLSHHLFQPARMWPLLSGEEIKLLNLYKASSGFSLGNLPRLRQLPDWEESDRQASFKTLAKLVHRRLALPYWASYEKVSKGIGRRIAARCPEVYGEECSLEEGIEIFQADLERGLKVQTLKVGPPMYRALPKFLYWIQA